MISDENHTHCYKVTAFIKINNKNMIIYLK